MKIEKGLTLSQFVDWMIKIAIPDTEHFQLIINYNNRLKEPLEKSMIVNPYEKPVLSDYIVNKEVHYDDQYMEYKEALRKWQEAEKKVIFKSVEALPTLVILSDDWYLTFDKMRIVEITDKTNCFYKDCKTLGDLFDATNGELELKNFEI